jgi:8-oxo-dGTP pyrophosphatase MutT (NUDIX family)
MAPRWVIAAMIAAVALAGCDSGSEPPPDTVEDLPERIVAPAGATPAQKAAADAQSPASGAAAAADPKVTPAAVRAALEEAGIRVEAVEEQQYTAFSLATSDADLTEPGDVIPSADPDKDGIVWFEETDPVGDKRFTAFAFHAGGRIVVSTLGEGGRRLSPGFRRLQKLLSEFD